MPNGDTQLAQSIYLANMFAQRGTCQCEACKLLRQATDGMIAQVLGKGGAGPGIPTADIMRTLGGSQLSGSGAESGG
jgi:hypothetical protein